MNFIENESIEKLRGGYYTPPYLADFLTRWIKTIHPRTILEPSCGDGVFFHALGQQRIRGAVATGFELTASEAGKARSAARDAGIKATIHAQDFLKWFLEHFDSDTRFDAVLGNPPFVRYQYLPPGFQARADQVFHRFNLHFTKHTNAWVPFVIASVALLRPGGRLAMVVPSEILHVLHAQSLRSYLGAECHRVVVIDPQELWFKKTLQGAVLLLAEKQPVQRQPIDGLGVHAVRGREFLSVDPETIFHDTPCINGKTVEGKWTRALLDQGTVSVLDELSSHADVHRFEDLADANVGIVTGANKFFLVRDDIVERYHLHKWAHPMFGRSDHCPGVIYNKRQHASNAKNGSPTNFVWFHDGARGLHEAANRYIKLGEKAKLHQRFKCRVRSPWYTVPSVYVTAIGMLKRSHDTPRLVLNTLGAYTTDTAYRIRPKNGMSARMLVASFMNPLTALSAELEGRHYGGGVLELVPSEIECLSVPIPRKLAVDVAELDTAVRNLPTEQLLERRGSAVLGALGVSRAMQEQLLNGWIALRNRRHRTPNPVG